MTTKYRINWKSTKTGATGHTHPGYSSHEHAQCRVDFLNAQDSHGTTYWVEPVEVAEEEQGSAEERQCDVCGEIWVDTGEPACPFCGSGDTNPVEEEQCNPD